MSSRRKGRSPPGNKLKAAELWKPVPQLPDPEPIAVAGRPDHDRAVARRPAAARPGPAGRARDRPGARACIDARRGPGRRAGLGGPRAERVAGWSGPTARGGPVPGIAGAALGLAGARRCGGHRSTVLDDPARAPAGVHRGPPRRISRGHPARPGCGAAVTTRPSRSTCRACAGVALPRPQAAEDSSSPRWREAGGAGPRRRCRGSWLHQRSATRSPAGAPRPLVARR
jgi:hypothetical protein